MIVLLWIAYFLSTSPVLPTIGLEVVIEMQHLKPPEHVIHHNADFTNSTKLSLGTELIFKDSTTLSYEDVEDFWQDLEEYVTDMPGDIFLKDPILLKFIDYAGGEIVFRHLDVVRMKRPLFRVPLTDLNRNDSVYAIRPMDDGRRIIQKMRQIPVLKRTNHNATLYHVFYMYIKTPPIMSKTESHEVRQWGGYNVTVEYDTWDNREGVEYRSQIFGWTHCNSSIFVTCLSKEVFDTPGSMFNASDFSNHTHNYDKPLPLMYGTRFQMNANGPYLTEDVIDYFSDLDDSDFSTHLIYNTIQSLYRSDTHYMLLHPDKTWPKFADFHSSFQYTDLSGGYGKHVNFVANGVDSGWTGGVVWRKPSVLPAVNKLVGAHAVDSMFRGLTDVESVSLLLQLQALRNESIGGLYPPLYPKNQTTDIWVSLESYHVSDLDFTESKLPTFATSVINKTLLMRTSLLHRPGWVMPFLRVYGHNVSINVDDEAFLGFGPCFREENLTSLILDPSNKEELIEGLMKVARTHCIQANREKIDELFAEGYLAFVDQRIVFRRTQWQLVKLTEDSLQKLGLAVELYTFAQVYREFLEEGEAYYLQTLNDTDLAATTSLLRMFACQSIKNIMTLPALRQYSIRLFRNLYKTMKTTLVRMIQDYIGFRDCGYRCKRYVIQYANDRRLLVGIMQYLLHGLQLVFTGSDPCISMVQFVLENDLGIVERSRGYINV